MILSLPTHNLRPHSGQLAVIVLHVAEYEVQSFIAILSIHLWYYLEIKHAEMINSHLLEQPRLDGFQGDKAIAADGASNHAAIVARQ